MNMINKNYFNNILRTCQPVVIITMIWCDRADLDYVVLSDTVLLIARIRYDHDDCDRVSCHRDDGTTVVLFIVRDVEMS